MMWTESNPKGSRTPADGAKGQPAPAGPAGAGLIDVVQHTGGLYQLVEIRQETQDHSFVCFALLLRLSLRTEQRWSWVDDLVACPAAFTSHSTHHACVHIHPGAHNAAPELCMHVNDLCNLFFQA